MTFINSKISNHLPQITANYIEGERELVPFFNRANEIENYLGRSPDHRAPRRSLQGDWGLTSNVRNGPARSRAASSGDP